VPVAGGGQHPLCPPLQRLQPGLEKTRVFKKKTSPVVSFVFLFFFVIVFFVFFLFFTSLPRGESF
jgi:hypothetical protein